VNPIALFGLMLKASLFSTGGFGNVPSLHDDLLARNWATETQFAESLAVGQVSPGPNGLWIISFGFLIDGLRGSLCALAAITLPPLFVFLVEWLYQRTKDHAAVEGFIRGMSLAMVGIFLVVLQRLLANIGADGRSLLILAASFGVGLTQRVPVVVVLGSAALIGLLLR
jgi:chromate transporter